MEHAGHEGLAGLAGLRRPPLQASANLEEGIFNLQIAVSPTLPALMTAVNAAIICEGGERKLGGAPAGNAERTVAKLLEATK